MTVEQTIIELCNKQSRVLFIDEKTRENFKQVSGQFLTDVVTEHNGVCTNRYKYDVVYLGDNYLDYSLDICERVRTFVPQIADEGTIIIKVPVKFETQTIINLLSNIANFKLDQVVDQGSSRYVFLTYSRLMNQGRITNSFAVQQVRFNLANNWKDQVSNISFETIANKYRVSVKSLSDFYFTPLQMLISSYWDGVKYASIKNIKNQHFPVIAVFEMLEENIPPDQEIAVRDYLAYLCFYERKRPIVITAETHRIFERYKKVITKIIEHDITTIEQFKTAEYSEVWSYAIPKYTFEQTEQRLMDIVNDNLDWTRKKLGANGTEIDYHRLILNLNIKPDELNNYCIAFEKVFTQLFEHYPLKQMYIERNRFAEFIFTYRSLIRIITQINPSSTETLDDDLVTIISRILVRSYKSQNVYCSRDEMKKHVNNILYECRTKQQAKEQLNIL